LKFDQANGLLGRLLTAVLLGVAAPAFASSFTYQGELTFSAHAGDVCAPAGTEATFKISVFGRDDSGSTRFEGYIYGEQLIPMHFAGNALDQLALSFPGEAVQSNGQLLRLRSTGPGAFEGVVPALPISTELIGCTPQPAKIHFALVHGTTDRTAQQVAELYQADTRGVIAFAQTDRGQVREALAGLNEAMSVVARSFGADSPQLLPYLLAISQAHSAQGTYPESVPPARRALTLCMQAFAPDNICTSAALANLARMLRESGQYAEAESAIRRSLSLAESRYGADTALSAFALNELGLALLATGQFAEAESSLRHAQALNAHLFGAESARVGTNLHNLGLLYRLTGQYPKAEAALRQALAIHQKTVGLETAPVAINSLMLAQVLSVEGKYSEAEPLFRQTLATGLKLLGPERPDHPVLGGCLAGLAQLLRFTGRSGEAEPLLRQALANARKFLDPDHPDVGAYSMLLGALLHEMGRNPEALEQLKRAYRIGSMSRNDLLAWRAPATLMHFYADGSEARPELAIFYGKEAVNGLQRLRGNLAANDEEAQRAFVSAAEVNTVYRTLSELLIGAGRLAEAQQVLGMLKQKEYFDFVERAADASPDTANASLTGPEPAWAQRYTQISAQLVKIADAAAPLKKKGEARTAAEQRQLDAYQADLDVASRKFDAVLDEIGRTGATAADKTQRAAAVQSTSTNFRHAIQDLGHSAVLAQYVVQDDKVQIILTTPTVIVAREAVISRQDLNAKVFAFREVLSTPKQNPLPQAQALYQLLLGPIAEDLRQSGASTLVLSLDGPLRYLPFAALHDGQHYVVESQAVVMLTEAAQGSLKDQPQSEWRIWGLGLTEAKPGFAALPNVRGELGSIIGPQGIEGKVQLDAQFTEGALREGINEQYPVIHIASHYQFTPGSSNDSFLLLGDGSRMSLSDIKAKLDLQYVDLLTLSACQTAFGGGEDANGMEVEGLGAVAQRQGAKAVLASLWPVADKSTALLMQDLYRLHKDQHLSKGAALQQAQLLLLHGAADAGGASSERGAHSLAPLASKADTFHVDPAAPFAHPYFWAPFILIGNWR
jgi:CHAT domain-containing protein